MIGRMFVRVLQLVIRDRLPCEDRQPMPMSIYLTSGAVFIYLLIYCLSLVALVCFLIYAYVNCFQSGLHSFKNARQDERLPQSVEPRASGTQIC